MSKVHIVSNRLPLRIVIQQQKVAYEHTVGGLANGLHTLPSNRLGYWFGWPGIASAELEEVGPIKSVKATITSYLKKNEHCVPLFLSKQEIDEYYLGFSNRTLNPLFHYFPQSVVYNDTYWQTYLEVNRQFAQLIARNIRPEDTVWIHDYHLLMLPQLLRKKFPELSIGFFLHIPFPSSELFKMLPWREQLIEGVLEADLIGFHTYDYARHFLNSLQSIKGVEHDSGWVSWKNRHIKIDTFPMGIDYQYFTHQASQTETASELKQLKKNKTKIILSVDRLDYAKGILQKLYAFEKLLTIKKIHRKHVSLVLVVAPSRTKVQEYKQLKKSIDQIVGRINGRFGQLNWQPIWYLYQSVSQDELIGFYKQSDVLLVTSLRDGMNLVSKEYVASQTDEDGVVVLSERVGAAREMPESLLVNPNDINQIADRLDQALRMPKRQRKQRMKALQNRLAYYDIYWWSNSFLDQLEMVKNMQHQKQTRVLSSGIEERLYSQFAEAKSRLILLDYDGTLVGFKPRPEDATPPKVLLEILRKLSSCIATKIVILSGRDAHFIEHYLGQLPVTLVAEHGLVVKKDGKEWVSNNSISQEWKRDILPILQLYVNRTAGSFIEEKNHCLVWHYRQVDSQLAAQRLTELKDDLRSYKVDDELGFIEGNKVLEIKPSHITKGTLTRQFVDEEARDFILAIGDDATDEHMFEQLPDSAYSIKVGSGNTTARFRISSYQEVRKLLKALADLKINCPS